MPIRQNNKLIDFKNILPYSSEVFGVYQPMLGWKSKRVEKRVARAATQNRKRLLKIMLDQLQPKYSAAFGPNCEMSIEDLDVASWPDQTLSRSLLIRELRQRIQSNKPLKPEQWERLIDDHLLKNILEVTVAPHAIQIYRELCVQGFNSASHVDRSLRFETSPSMAETKSRKILADETRIAGLLLELKSAKAYSSLNELFFPKYKLAEPISSLLKQLEDRTSFDTLDPKKDLSRVGLSPIGIVHLFRQYFFEFDTFLGTPVGHIWVSPGSTVELIEINSRRTLVERSEETGIETRVNFEKSSTVQDDLSEAVKDENRTNSKFGATVTASQNWAWGSANETANFGLETTQGKAREEAHKHMRSQTEKLSTEMKTTYKTTFKTLTETTETSSKKYILGNATNKLINYELRRKMRQVGVQVQDIGTYLCWQTYVDDPGAQLGIANLLHIAEPPDLKKITPPDLIEPLQNFPEETMITIPYQGDDGDNDVGYRDGVEDDVGWAEEEDTITADFLQTVHAKPAEFRLDHVEFDVLGADARLSCRDIKQEGNTTKWTYIAHLDWVNFQDQESLTVKAILHWASTQDVTVIQKKNEERLAQFTAQQAEVYQKSFVEAARERIKFASGIKPRNFEDLREEERIIVYRKLIQDILMPEKLVPMPDNQTRHVAAELLSSIFDIDKMLYFVAPDWWRPQLHASRQTFGSKVPLLDESGNPRFHSDGSPMMVATSETQFSAEHSVSWGGKDEARDANYYITEESTPARLGSSLGWLLQLDGDDRRNAFLNAPWVKAVIPIRPGKEKQALNWLKHVEGMNSITGKDLYTGTEPEFSGKTIFEVLDLLAEQVAKKHAKSITTAEFKDPAPTAGDPANTVTATPVDRVYEHGFYPLQGGFRSKVGEDFEIFDQWVEVLPTDQVVAVEVSYDPKTGRQI